jgi:hypothetical protein
LPGPPALALTAATAFLAPFGTGGATMPVRQMHRTESRTRGVKFIL